MSRNCKDCKAVCKAFPFFQGLSISRQEVLCLIMQEVGFLGMTERLTLVNAIRRGDIFAICNAIEDKDLANKYRIG